MDNLSTDGMYIRSNTMHNIRIGSTHAKKRSYKVATIIHHVASFSDNLPVEVNIMTYIRSYVATIEYST